MGWFDFLFGKKAQKESPDSPGAGLSSRQALERAWKHWWKFDTAEHRTYLEAWFREALSDRGELRFIQKEPENELQVRGHLGRVPFRVKLDLRSLNMDIEARFPNPRGFIDLEWDPEVKPSSPVERDPVWDEEDEKREFLADHIFIEGSSAEEEAESFRQLPAQLQQRVLQTIAASHLRFFRIRPEGTEVSPSRTDGNDLQPLFDLPAILDLLQALSDAVPRLTEPEEENSEEDDAWEDESDDELDDDGSEPDESTDESPEPAHTSDSFGQADPHEAWLRELASRDSRRS
jgi:hypothetical protein